MHLPSSDLSHTRGYALIRELADLFLRVADPDEAMAAALEVLYERTAAAAGIGWRMDLAGQWQLLAVHGEPVVRDAILERHAEPPADPAHVRSRCTEEGTAWVRVHTPQGGPAAALLLAGVHEQWFGEGFGELLEAVAGVLGQGWSALTQHREFAEAQRVAGIGRWHWRADTDRVWLSEQMYRNLGTTPDRFEHTLAGYLARVHPQDRDDLATQVELALDQGGTWLTTHRMITDDGEERCIEGHGQVVFDEHGIARRITGMGQDVTHRRVLEQQLADRIERDQLTGLANRHLFQQTLQQAIDDAANHEPPISVAVALVDVDRFRTVNELHGWAAGDQLLQDVAERLRSVASADLVARLSADEFALLFVDTAPLGTLDSLAEQISARLHEPGPLRVHGQAIHLGVGVASNLDDGDLSDQLLRSASVALQVAKSRTNARWQVFDPAKHDKALQRLAMEADLRSAIEQGEIELVYQPIVAAETSEITGVEALARWNRPGHGPVSPATFIPLAERIGLMPRLGADVLDGACRQLQAWDRDLRAARRLRLTVNLSATQLDDPHLVDAVGDVLSRYRLDPDRLVLEVTETTIAHDTPAALARLFELRRRGVRIAIDDFGTGYSSLARLREIPFDILKIDRSFVKDIASRHEPTPILQALFSISRSLDLAVVAEGVETPVQLAVMMAHDCQLIQGFLLSRPLEPASLEALLDGSPPWDLTAIAGEVPTHRTSGRLQRLLDELASNDAEPAPGLVGDILTVVGELTGLESVYLTRVDLREDVQEILAAHNVGEIQIEPGLQVPWTETLCRRALATGHPVIHDVQRAHPDADVARELDIGTYVGVEIHGPKGGLRGTLCGVTASVTDVPQETIETLQWVARLLADPVQQASDRPRREPAEAPR